MFAERFAQLAVLGDGALDAVEQVLLAEWFLQEIEGAMLHGFDGHGDVAVPGHEDDRDDGATQIQLLLKLEPAHAGHADVENQAALLRGLIGRREIPARKQTACN